MSDDVVTVPLAGLSPEEAECALADVGHLPEPDFDARDEDVDPVYCDVCGEALDETAEGWIHIRLPE